MRGIPLKALCIVPLDYSFIIVLSHEVITGNITTLRGLTVRHTHLSISLQFHVGSVARQLPFPYCNFSGLNECKYICRQLARNIGWIYSGRVLRSDQSDCSLQRGREPNVDFNV